MGAFQRSQASGIIASLFLDLELKNNVCFLRSHLGYFIS